MGDVVDLYEPERYCLNDRCNRVDCDRHCWGCGAVHDSTAFGEFPFCQACDIEYNTEQDIDLRGFWEPPEMPPLATDRRKQVCLDVSLEDLLREVGQQWLKDKLDDS